MKKAPLESRILPTESKIKTSPATMKIIRNSHRSTVKASPRARNPLPNNEAQTFGLIQESIAPNLYFLVIQAILWNQTHGRQARPVFFAFIEKYPDAEPLSEAALGELTAMLQPLGLHNIRARRCIALAKWWMEDPPSPTRYYRRRDYPGVTLIRPADREFEITHPPGVGPYALDSFGIFHRDEMRRLTGDRLGTGASQDGFEPEWKRVLPKDKELRAYLS